MQVQKIREFTGHTAAIYSLCASARPGHFVSCGSEGVVAEWNVATGEGRALAQAPAAVFSIALLPDRNQLILGLQSGDIIFVDLASGQALKRVQLHKRAIFDLLPLPDGQHLLAASEEGAISLWNLDRMDHLHWQVIAPMSVRTLALDATGTRLYAGASDGVVRELDLGLSLVRVWQAHRLSVFRLLPMGDRLFTTGRDAHINAWELDGTSIPSCVHSVPAHNYAVNDLVVHPAGWLLSGSMDKSWKVWDPTDLTLLKVVSHEKNGCHWNGVNRLLMVDDVILSCSDDRKIMAWEIA